MNKKLLLKFGAIISAIIFCILVAFGIRFTYNDNLELQFCINEDIKDLNEFCSFYVDDSADDMVFSQERNIAFELIDKETNKYGIVFPLNTHYLRIDVGTGEKKVHISDMAIMYGSKKLHVSNDDFGNITSTNELADISCNNNSVLLHTEGNDPYFVWDISKWEIRDEISLIENRYNIVLKGIIIVIIIAILFFFLKHFNFYVEFPTEIYHCKKLIGQLAKNDFRTKYAGSYLGITWAFVQPIVTVVLYWFVFEKGLRSGQMMNVPFVLWLIAGLVPWFFFSDSWNGGTTSLMEYQYLVKKVVFQIDILPLVKIISAVFVHLFFVAFTLILYACYGYFPTVYALQIIYYSFCTLVLALGLSYATSAMVGFFKDLTQIIAIILQVGTWMTPILWSFDSIDLPGWLKVIFKLNPMFYVVQGYRDSLINHVWFFERTGTTIYFWIVTVVILGLGTMIFKKLKIHFADVL